MSSLFSIYHKVCPACASMRPREETRCICGHSFSAVPIDPELTEEQLYEDYLRARMQQIQEMLRSSDDSVDTGGKPLTRPEQMRAQTELRAVQAELDRQRARIERMRRSSKAWMGNPSVAGQRGRSEGPRVAQAAEALAQELARLRRDRQSEIEPVRAWVSARRQPPEDQALGVRSPETPANADAKIAEARPESFTQEVASVPPATDPEPPRVTSPVEHEESVSEPEQSQSPDLHPAPEITGETTQVTGASGDIGETPHGDVRVLLGEQGERTRLRQQSEALIECPNCTAHFPKTEPRCKCGFEQPAIAALMPAITLDPGERQRLGPLLKPD